MVNKRPGKCEKMDQTPPSKISPTQNLSFSPKKQKSLLRAQNTGVFQ